MKRLAIALTVVLALGLGSSTALAAPHHGGHHGHHGHHSARRHHGHHGHHGPRRPRPPVVRIYTPGPYYYPPVRVCYPPYYRSPEANLAIGIGRVVGAAIEMGR